MKTKIILNKENTNFIVYHNCFIKDAELDLKNGGEMTLPHYTYILYIFIIHLLMTSQPTHDFVRFLL